MLRPEEYLESETFDGNVPDEIWVHGLEILAHCMQGDPSKTFYKDRNNRREYLNELQQDMEEHCQADIEALNNVLEDQLRRDKKWRQFDDIEGDLDIDRFLADRNGKREDPIYNNFKKDKKHKPAMNLLLDMSIPWHERESDAMLARHREIYELAVQAQNEGRPCRVIAAYAMEIPERPRTKDYVMFIVIKDFSEPIFAGIWGAFKTCRSTNSFLNVVMDYFIGTRCTGNGTPGSFNALEYFQENEVKVISARRISMKPISK